MKFIVTTDSGCDLPRSLLEERGVLPCMMNYTMDGELCTDTMEHGDCHAFYEKMRAGSSPKTSQFNPAQFEDFWRPLLEQGLPIVHICLCSGVSGTFNNGVMAARALEEEVPGSKIYVLDSTLCSTGYGMLALEAARMRDEGLSAEACMEWLEANKVRVNTWYTTDELLYLRRSGRCSRASAAIGSAPTVITSPSATMASFGMPYSPAFCTKVRKFSLRSAESFGNPLLPRGNTTTIAPYFFTNGNNRSALPSSKDTEFTNARPG